MTEGVDLDLTVAITRQNGYAGPVPLSIAMAPPGVTATFNPQTLTGATLTSTLTISAADSVTPNEYGVVVTATGSNGNPVGVPFLLGVARPRINVSKLGTGSGTVTSSPPGINCGNTCGASFIPGSNVTLTAAASAGSAFAGWDGACTGTATTCTITPSGKTPFNVNATFNSITPGFTMALSTNAVSVQQGSTGSATLTFTRNNGFTGAVNVAITGAPTGLTVTPNPASVTGTTSTLNVTAATTLAAGSYPLTVTATATGVPTQTASLSAQVTPGSGGNGTVALSFATCDPTAVPIWLAVQSGTGPWTRVTAGAGNTFTFTPGATGGVAYVTPQGSGFSTTVVYASASEITAFATGPGPCGTTTQLGTKHLAGQVANNGGTFPTTVSIGGAESTFFGVNGPNFTLTSVPAGVRDYIGSYSMPSQDNTTSGVRLVLRHNVNYADNSTIPTADFGGAEGFFAVQTRDTLVNLGSDQSVINTSFVTANGVSAPFYSGIGGLIGGLPTLKNYSVPDAMLLPGDFHVTLFGARPSSGTAFRLVVSMQHSPTSQTITFGPPLSTPTITSVASAPYLRLQAQWASQSAYNTAATASYQQGNNSFAVTSTAAYNGGLPANWLLSIPDLTAAGYNVAWGLRQGVAVDWSVNAAGGNFLPFVGAPPVDGAVGVVGGVSSAASVTFSRRWW